MTVLLKSCSTRTMCRRTTSTRARGASAPSGALCDRLLAGRVLVCVCVCVSVSVCVCMCVCFPSSGQAPGFKAFNHGTTTVLVFHAELRRTQWVLRFRMTNQGLWRRLLSKKLCVVFVLERFTSLNFHSSVSQFVPPLVSMM